MTSVNTSQATSASLSVTPYGTQQPAPTPPARKPLSLPRLREMHARGEKITMLTAYDATFAAVADAATLDQWLHAVPGTVVHDDMAAFAEHLICH